MRGVGFEEQIKTIEILQKNSIDIVPVVLAARNNNENELGTIIEDLFIKYSHVKSIIFSLMTYTGSGGGGFENDALNRLTIPSTLDEIQKSSSGRIKKSDFIPLPMANPMCAAVGYFLVMDNEITPLIQFGEKKEIIEYIKNGHFGNLTPEFAGFIEKTIYKIFSNPAEFSFSDQLLSKFRRLFQLLFPHDKTLTHSERVKLSEEHLRVVYLMQFMDNWSFDSVRLNRCSCQHSIPDSGVIPTCSFYCYHRNAETVEV